MTAQTPQIRDWSAALQAEEFLLLYQSIFPEKAITAETIQSITREPATVWVMNLSAEPELVGFLYFWTILDELQIVDIGVLPEKRRLGLGKILLQRLIERADLEQKKITLEVRVKNKAAIALYEKMGFVRSGKRKRYYADGEDAYLYSFQR